MGKTTAMLIKIIQSIKVEKRELQAIFFCINFEAAFQAYTCAKEITNKWSIDVIHELVPSASKDPHTQIMFGSVFDAIRELESRKVDVEKVDIVVFDDGNRTMTSEKSMDCVIKKLNADAKLFYLAPTQKLHSPSHDWKKSVELKAKIEEIRKCVVQKHLFNNVDDNIQHYAVQTSGYQSKFNVLAHICDIIASKSLKAIIFCSNNKQSLELTENLSKKFGTTVLLYCGRASHNARMVQIEELNQEERSQIILATDCLSIGVDISNAAICIIYDVRYNTSLNEIPNKRMYFSLTSRIGRFGKEAIAISLVDQNQIPKFTSSFPFCQVLLIYS